jgi:putative spermidine/putrescine transport system substrate-binding protein
MGLLSLALAALLIVAACGESATATPEPEEAMPEATPTAMMEEDAEPSTGLRPISEWTVDNPATHEEIEAALAAHQGGSFTFVSWGGSYQEMQRKAFLLPFAEKFGVNIVEDGPPDYAKVRAMAHTGNVTWDVVDGSGQAGVTMGLEGVLEELDESIIDKSDLFPHIRDAPWIGGGGSAYSMVMMYSTNIYPDGGPQPSSWADYLDKEKFPGIRGMIPQDWNWKHMVRWPLIADDPSLIETEEGRASLSAMSPEQLDKAWRLVEEQWIPAIDIFTSGIYDCIAFLDSGELDICQGDNGAAFNGIVEENFNVAACWECGHDVLTDNWWVIKGIKEEDPKKWELINLFFAWTQHPEIAASQALYQPFGPTNLKSAPFLDEPGFDRIRPFLPTADANLPYAILMDEAADGEIGGPQAEIWFEVQGKN